MVGTLARAMRLPEFRGSRVHWDRVHCGKCLPVDTSGSPEKCIVCGHRSNEPAPFASAVSGVWPWLEYEHVFGEHGEKVAKKASGSYCSVCHNVFYVAGLNTKPKYGCSFNRFINICHQIGNHGMLNSFRATTRYHVWLMATKQSNYNYLRRRLHKSRPEPLTRYFELLERERKRANKVLERLRENVIKEFVPKDQWDETHCGKWDDSNHVMAYISGKYVAGMWVERARHRCFTTTDDQPVAFEMRHAVAVADHVNCKW